MTASTAPSGGQQILAVDVGTQSVRAIVFDAVGSVVAIARTRSSRTSHRSPAGPNRTQSSIGGRLATRVVESWTTLPSGATRLSR